MVITIIGGGSASVSFLYSYLQLIPGENELSTTIYLVEKRGVFGPGAAYTADSASNILNTKTGFITPFHDKPADFFNWLACNNEVWARRFPDFKLEENSYAPRPLFGIYLQSRMAWLIKQAIARNVRIIQVDAEAIDVSQVGSSYVTKTNCGLNLTSDYVFFFCGTLPAKPRGSVMKSNRILSNPYPVTELPHKIPHDAHVAIVGARLSCIDAVIGLVENGHKGQISIHSRSGYFPSVRGTQGRITPKFLTASYVESLVRSKGKLRIKDIVGLVMREISLASDKIIHPAFQLPPPPPTDIQAYLREEIRLAREPRFWQAVLYSTNAIIDQLWFALHDDDKSKFLNKYFSIFMSYRVSIPVENAVKILRYLESGQVRFHPGDFSVALGDDERPVISLKMDKGEKPMAYDYIIEATGSPRSVHHLESELVRNLLQKGTMMPHEFGGIVVDPMTYQLISTSGRVNPSLYAVGELTTGTFFFTSALDIIARHARRCAIQFSESLSTVPSRISNAKPGA
ncbi:MAG: FAD/NAD(P)-binding protein [Pseudomonadota bacterium]|nr:FAD/NAD(P)-binding protein [Pseudomonadota bacterium]